MWKLSQEVGKDSKQRSTHRALRKMNVNGWEWYLRVAKASFSYSRVKSNCVAELTSTMKSAIR